jgi:hypothetical protein
MWDYRANRRLEAALAVGTGGFRPSSENGEMEADMKVFRSGQLCLLAMVVLGLSVCASASASEYEVRSLPELGRCVKVATGTGEFKGGQCITPEVAGGKRGNHNWVQANVTEKLTFTSAGVEPKLATAGHPTVTCAVMNVSGTFTGPKTATSEIELQGCENSVGELCHGIGAENQIKSAPLEAELGFIKNELVEGKYHVNVGLDFRPQPPLTALLTYQCGSESSTTASVEGSVIVTDKPIDKMTASDVLFFHVVKGAQTPEKFEGGVNDTLTTKFTTGIESTSAPSTLGTKEANTGTYSVPLEIKAIEK